ncbi:hypothetical protein SAMN05216378_2958 [Paenibacillus catalpae]|uniref:SLH domain-containing protein n=1 Tax=Paenibacillus catalpae TaxID=1045775 RepID=A0A1I1Z6H8_9BACL|nr:hypothetical protein [Paenibacillus catalpae]SFE27162.1 hypothetical protein SAMN05216378_2958 [Paenibacillus catalpae]
MKSRTKWLLSGSLALSLLFSSALPLSVAEAAAVQTNAVQQSSTTAIAENELFLQEKYGIAFQAGSVTKGQFLQHIAKILKLESAESSPAFTDLNADSPYYTSAAALYEQGIITSLKVDASQPLQASSALYIAVKAAGLAELAHTYPLKKTTGALKQIGYSPAGLSLSAAQELAAAVHSGLLPSSLYKEVKGKAASPELAETLLVQILSIKGDYKHYIGYTSDADIYGKLADAYNTSDIIQSPELQTVVDTALKQNLVTGYNLKDDRYDANFVDSLSLTYGHDNLKHAVQLIGLLRSEGIRAKVQFEPKTSAFIYLKEWGEPVQSDSYKVVQIENGNYIAYAKEYDLKFEFNNAADKARFQSVILQYAKKNSEDQTGLIASSWWQPLYYSLTKLDDYIQITNNKITGKGHYYAQSFSLNEPSAAIAEGFKQLGAGLHIQSYPIWVDKPFFNYLNGEPL